MCSHGPQICMPSCLPQRCMRTPTSSLMLTSSVSVSMTTICEPHSYTMRQKSGTVSKSGPCAAATQLRPDNDKPRLHGLLSLWKGLLTWQ